jgi:hypothetical protein
MTAQASIWLGLVENGLYLPFPFGFLPRLGVTAFNDFKGQFILVCLLHTRYSFHAAYPGAHGT